MGMGEDRGDIRETINKQDFFFHMKMKQWYKRLQGERAPFDWGGFFRKEPAMQR